MTGSWIRSTAVAGVLGGLWAASDPILRLVRCRNISQGPVFINLEPVARRGASAMSKFSKSRLPSKPHKDRPKLYAELLTPSRAVI